MHNSRMVTSFYCLTGIAAAFLSWASQSLLGRVIYLKGIDPDYSVTQMKLGDGWITLLCFSAVLLVVVNGNRQQAMNLKKLGWLVLIALISLVISVYHIIKIFALAKTTTGDVLVMKVSPGVGLYLTILVSLALLILPFKHRAIMERTKSDRNT